METLHVIFSLADTEYALSAAEVLHMESYDGATPVPGTASFVAGLVQVRGKVVPVIDLRARFGMPPVARSEEQRVMVVQCGARTAGLLVDRAREVLAISPEQLTTPPELIAHQSHGFIGAVAHVHGRILMLLDVARVIGPGSTHADAEEQQHAQQQ
jgi:purine-binding chemotaxis protein CheW